MKRRIKARAVKRAQDKEKTMGTVTAFTREEPEASDAVLANIDEWLTDRGNAKIDEAWKRFTHSVAGEEAAPAWREAHAHMENQHGTPHDSLDNSVAEFGGKLAQGFARWEHETASSPSPSKKRRSRRRLGVAGRVGVAGAAAALVIGFLFTNPGSRALADIFQTFTVSHIDVTNPSDMQVLQTKLASLAQSGKTLSLKQYGSVHAAKVGTPVTETLGQAQTSTGLSIPTLPGVASPTVRVRQGMSVTFRIHVSAVNSLLSQLGASVLFPQSADNQPIVLKSNPIVVESAPNGSVRLLVTREPVLKVPQSVDVNQVREALLSIPFLPADITSVLSSSTNWADTLVVPNNGNLASTTVDGNQAVIDAKNGQLVWLKNGVVYGLMGPSRRSFTGSGPFSRINQTQNESPPSGRVLSATQLLSMAKELAK